MTEMDLEDETESVRILGIGVGLFLIILVWAAALSALLLVSRLALGPSLAAVGLASLVTAILVAIPRDAPIHGEVVEEEFKLYDGMFVWRTIVRVILCVAGLAGSAIALLDWGMHQVRPEAVKMP